MASTYTHAIVADQLAQNICGIGNGKISSEYQSFILSDTILIQIGAFCPDLPYLDETYVPDIFDVVEQARWGDLMHFVHSGKLIFWGTEKLQEMKNCGDMRRFRKCFPWFLGLVSHLIVDTVVHPVVEKIVGPYFDGKEMPHMECEMYQDVWLNDLIYKAKLPELNLIETVKRINDKEIIEFWEELLKFCYRFYWYDAPPVIVEWIKDYQSKVSSATSGWFAFGPFTKYCFPDLSGPKTKKFILDLETPIGKMSYDKIFTEHMIPRVLDFWKIVIDGISGKSKIYQRIEDFDMDSGKYLKSGKYVSWEK